MGWSAGDFGRDHLLEPGEVEARTEPVHDGTQTDPE
jgi:hypothetical protein